MSESKHTPGDWTLHDAGERSGNIIRFEIMGVKGQSIAEIECFSTGDTGCKSHGEVLANARLMKAAPDLLAACEAAQKVINCIPHEQAVAVPGISRLLRAAIAKAKGRP